MRKLCLLPVALLALAPLLLVAAQRQNPVESSSAQKTEDRRVEPRSGAPQCLIFMGKVKEASTGKLESFFKKEVMPTLSKDGRVLSIDTHRVIVGSDLTYIVLLKIKPDVPLTFDTAFQVLANGRTPQEALEVLDRFAGFFDTGTTITTLHRSDLSLFRGAGMLAGAQGPALGKDGRESGHDAARSGERRPPQ
ncbi:MAG: hypothetical protein IRY99_14390 [Isosphaeraceae bacterium]|nr:hypothetical protein [Isosphaeraceae bacterium]